MIVTDLSHWLDNNTRVPVTAIILPTFYYLMRNWKLVDADRVLHFLS